MKKVWLWLLPLLFLPNLGQALRTPFGVLEMSDFLMVPYLAALLLAVRPRPKLRLYRAAWWLGAFLSWALLSTLVMSWRYDHLSATQLPFSLLKLGKFAMYGGAGLLTGLALASSETRRGYHWALLVAAALLGVSLFLFPPSERIDLRPMGYLSDNAVSVMVAMLVCYLGGIFATGLGTPAWRRAASVLLPVALLGATMTRGRGGWLAGLAGAAYLAAMTGVRRRTVVTFGVAAGLLVAAYVQLPTFARQVDATIRPEQAQLDRTGAGVMGFDDGKRTSIWTIQAPLVFRAPLLGTGFYHRGDDTDLFNSGSHNFWLQMFLETGLPGGCLMLLFVSVLWRDAGAENGEAHLRHSIRAALITALVGGLGGEYFYGGIVLFSLLLVYAPVGTLASGEPASGAGRTTSVRHGYSRPSRMIRA